MDNEEEMTELYKKRVQDKQKRIENILLLICICLATVFTIMLSVFLVRQPRKGSIAASGNISESVNETTQGNESTALITVNGTTDSSAIQQEAEAVATDSSASGEPVVFTFGEDQSMEGDWLFAQGNQLVDREGKPVWLTGINWFGYNTGTNCFDGLWACDLNSSIKTIADHGFNLLRIPISTELLLQWKNGEYPAANFNQATNDYLVGMNSLEIFDYVLALCEENGIKVMLDVHCAKTNAAGHNVNLWSDQDITEEDFIDAWVWVATRYADNDTLIAYDLENEPHGKPAESPRAMWNDSTDAQNWKYIAEKTAAAILAVNPNVLIVIEGIEIYPVDIAANGDYHSTSEEDYYYSWWGGNLRGVADYPIDLGAYNNKLVYSPHDYGPTVFAQPWFEGDYNYDTLMADCWEENWFFIYEQEIGPILIGEWGGFMTEPNLTWMTHLRTLIQNYHLNYTFWCFNSNSGDTGGLVLDDFTTWDEEKYAFVKEVLWQQNGRFVGLDHEIALGSNGITLSDAYVEDF